MKDNYKRAKTYCIGCDRAVVALGKKCSICGVTNKKGKLRKLSKSDLFKELLESL